mgnify:CR=1 FL=1
MRDLLISFGESTFGVPRLVIFHIFIICFIKISRFCTTLDYRKPAMNNNNAITNLPKFHLIVNYYFICGFQVLVDYRKLPLLNSWNIEQQNQFTIISSRRQHLFRVIFIYFVKIGWP